MTKPIPSPCDKCPRVKTCGEVCIKWIEWLFTPESEEKYRQETLK